MKYISHRGNTNGRFESYENEPNYIDIAIKKGFDVEIDVWYKDNMLWLGHDRPDYCTDFRWFRDRISKLWIHCKNIEAIEYFSTSGYDYNYFWHQDDLLTLTSHKYIWVFTGKQPVKGSIAVMPELNDEDINQCLGICSDYIEKYRK